jgi:glycosyltransferase involved in cell wall biosynthesis
MSLTSSVEISAVMPAFNEEANLEQSVGRMAVALAAQGRAFEVIVVDDGSRDGTAAVLERLRAIHPSLRVVRHPVNRGYGAALRSGFAAAHYPWVFLMDADNQFDPADVAALLAVAADADIVAGYRKQRRDPLPRRLNARAFFTLVTILFGRLARDVNCAFKLMRRDLLDRMDLHSEEP